MVESSSPYDPNVDPVPFDPNLARAMEAVLAASDSDEGRCMRPAVLVQKYFGGMWPRTPEEIFTKDDDPPGWRSWSRRRDIPKATGKDEIPIDAMGRYFPKTRKTKIYTHIIAQFVSEHNELDRELVEFIVRVHEYGHALVHIGVLSESHTLEGKGPFVTARNNLFSTIHDDTHEFLAQAITWSVLSREEDLSQARSTFVEIIKNQPSEYQLSEQLRNNRELPKNILPFIISLLHRGFFDNYGPPGISEAEFAAQLRARLESGNRPNEMSGTEEPKLSQSDVQNLKKDLIRADVEDQRRSLRPEDLSLLLNRIHKVAIHVYSNDGQRHKEPHFHARVNEDESASYSISDCKLLAGRLRRPYQKAVRNWWQAHKAKLHAAWRDAIAGRAPIKIEA